MAPDIQRKRKFSVSEASRPDQKQISQLLSKQADISFPRGGASILTPLEVKEIANEAARDVLFETNEAKATEPLKKKSKNTKFKNKNTAENKKHSISDKDIEESEHISIDEISKNILKVGSMVLGQVRQVNEFNVILSLPSGRTGFVSITDISDEITDRVVEYENSKAPIDSNSNDSESESESESDAESENEDEDTIKIKNNITKSEPKEKFKIPTIKNLIKVGQWLRAIVIEPNHDLPAQYRKKKGFKQIVLSLEPSLVNQSLDTDDLIPNQTIQGTIKSIEDHIIIFNVCAFKEYNFFLHKSDLPKDTNLTNYNVGSMQLLSIKSVANKTINVTLASNFSKKNQNLVKNISSIDSVVPGNLVNLVISQISKNGIAGKIYGVINSSINLIHLNLFNFDQLQNNFQVGSIIKVRVLASYIINNSKKLFVSILEKILTFKESRATELFQLKGKFSIGSVINGAEIVGEDSERFYFNLGSNKRGFALKTDTKTNSISDEKVVGTKCNAAIMRYDTYESRFLLSLKDGYITREYISPKDVPIGKILTVTVKKIQKTNKQESIRCKTVGSNFPCYVPHNQVNDLYFIKASQKYKVGDQVEARVINYNHDARELILTFRDSFINANKNEIITSWKNIKVDNSYIGYISQIKEDHDYAEVSFFGDVKGALSKYKINKIKFKKIENILTLNQTIKVNVLSVNLKKKNLKLDYTSKDSNDNETKGLKNLISGQSIIENAIIKKKTSKSITVNLPDNDSFAVIEYVHLSDEKSSPQKLMKDLKIGKNLECLVLKAKGNALLLTCKKSLIESAKNHLLPRSFSDLKLSDQPLYGYIASITDKQLFIRFADDLTGCMKKKDALGNHKSKVLLRNIYSLNESIKCYVSKIETAKKQFFLKKNPPFSKTINDNADKDSSKKVNLKSKIEPNNHKFAEKPIFRPKYDPSLTIKEVEIGKFYGGIVKLVSRNYVNIKLSDTITGSSFITEALDDYDLNLSDTYQPKSIVTCKVLCIDSNNKKLTISLRDDNKKTSKDPYYNSFEQLKRGDVVRGFIKNIADIGVFIYIGRNLTALVRITDLSDDFVKDWKNEFKVNQLVKGRILSSNGEGQILMTLKKSQVEGKLLKIFSDIKVDDIFEGIIKNIAEFGIFVNLKGTNNINGLCHKSEISDSKNLSELKGIFNVGDKIKVKVLKIDNAKKKLSLGMKASYFINKSISKNEDIEMADIDISKRSIRDKEFKSTEADENFDFDSESDIEMKDFSDEEGESESESESESEDEDNETDTHENEDLLQGLTFNSLSTNGFDWTASILNQADDKDPFSDDEDFMDVQKKKKKVKKTQTEDKTAQLNSRTPQSVADYERLLIGDPNSSTLWVGYMGFQLSLSEIEKAREIGERALKTIFYREEEEKRNIWIALLNLENSFGTDETLDKCFKKSCQYMDSLTMHKRLLYIYRSSSKVEKAIELYNSMIKKFGSGVSVWIEYGEFLVEQNKNDEARELLGKALGVLPKRDHLDVVRKFATIEFQKGDPEQGRSLFEGLIADVPKRLDIWNGYIDQEIKQDEKEKVEELFERLIVRKMSKKQAKFFFTKWLNFEETKKDEKAVDYVKAKAIEHVQGTN
ncbi:Rrp5p [Ascoidea rubescens DSM 1968]|uniref:TPR-like protein n=1 Tax=Ascoidea rubescens DSM 1968 TaxID=1344418 RepID=A0A1D2VRV0_9ASCO|nr:TPR-like protein [Ascoidea rubescens DSM 1968]ODV64285.1 TPR-like protein [Ascoidea rubescens DSM 1968]